MLDKVTKSVHFGERLTLISTCDVLDTWHVFSLNTENTETIFGGITTFIFTEKEIEIQKG